MADTTVAVDNGVGTHQRVAYDLMKTVISYADDAKYKSVDDILTLYHQCLQATYERHVKR